MPDSDLPRFPLNDEAPPAHEEELPTVPHSLAPLSGADGEGSEGESESPWSEVWRRRWFVVGAALVVFLSALAFGRVRAARHADVTFPTLSGASQTTKPDVPAIGNETDQSPPVARGPESQSPVADEVAAREPPAGTPDPEATSEALEIPPTEVPPTKGSSSGRVRSRKAAAPAGTAPHKRFMPGAI